MHFSVNLYMSTSGDDPYEITEPLAECSILKTWLVAEILGLYRSLSHILLRRLKIAQSKMTVYDLLNPATVAPSGPFSHGLIIPAGQDIIVTAGQIGTTDPKGTIAETYEEQVSASIKNLGDVLAEAGAGPEHIIKWVTLNENSEGEPPMFSSGRN